MGLNALKELTLIGYKHFIPHSGDYIKGVEVYKDNQGVYKITSDETCTKLNYQSGIIKNLEIMKPLNANTKGKVLFATNFHGK